MLGQPKKKARSSQHNYGPTYLQLRYYSLGVKTHIVIIFIVGGGVKTCIKEYCHTIQYASNPALNCNTVSVQYFSVDIMCQWNRTEHNTRGSSMLICYLFFFFQKKRSDSKKKKVELKYEALSLQCMTCCTGVDTPTMPS